MLLPGKKTFKEIYFRVNVSSDQSIVGVNLENLIDQSSFVRRKNKARYHMHLKDGLIVDCKC